MALQLVYNACFLRAFQYKCTLSCVGPTNSSFFVEPIQGRLNAQRIFPLNRHETWSFGKVEQNTEMSTLVPYPSSNFRPTSVRCSNERRALFSRIAPVYDNLNDLLSLGQHRIWKRMAVSWTGAKMGDRVLDACCGSGDLAFLLSKKVGSDGKVTGLDFSKDQLLVASSRSLSKNCLKNIEWVEGDALDLPFADGWFDAITVGYGLRNVVDKRKAMREILRVLKPGSTVSVLDFNKSNEPLTSSITEWMIDNIVVPVASVYGLSEEYRYLKSSIREFLTGKELEKLALEVGFSTARHYEIGGGLMGCLVAKR